MSIFHNATQNPERKVLGRASSPNKAAKDEKARKKAHEFYTLFGDEVHALIKNLKEAFYILHHGREMDLRTSLHSHTAPEFDHIEISSSSGCESLEASAIRDMHNGFVTHGKNYAPYLE